MKKCPYNDIICLQCLGECMYIYLLIYEYLLWLQYVHWLAQKHNENSCVYNVIYAVLIEWVF